MKHMPADSWDAADHILCVRLDTIGDVVMTTPAIRALKQSGPERRITLLTSPIGAEAARYVPEIDDVIAYEAPWMKATDPRMDSGPEQRMIDDLRARGFDAAVIFTVYSQNPLPSAFLCYMADIPRRLGYCHENPYQLLTDWIPDPEPEELIRHEARRQLDLVETIGATADDERLSFAVPDRARGNVDRMLHEEGIDPTKPWTVVHPGATAPSRRYPPDSFAEVTRQLASTEGWQVVFTGTASEQPLVSEIREGTTASTYSLVSKLDLGELGALIERAPMLISNNTGPVHIASATGTPTVDLYALTNMQHGPWQVPGRVLFQDVSCKLCYKSVCPEGHHDCLERVPPGAVVEAARELAAVGVAGGRAGLSNAAERIDSTHDEWIYSSAELLEAAGGDVS